MDKHNNLLTELITTISTLRGKNGCPWDRKQTAESLVKYVHSECEELIEAIEKKDIQNICEELGDVLYLIIMLSEIYQSQGEFSLSDVVRTINEKLIRRHPHVFANKTYRSEEELALQWQAIKAAEKSKKSV